MIHLISTASHIFSITGMERFCLTVYPALRNELACLRRTKLCSEKKVEGCFQVAHRYWRRLEKQLTTYQFQSVEEEIRFFKTLKPKFTSFSKAKQLMEEGLPMKQAAPMAGYRITSFITAFKRRFGFSPGMLQKKK